MKRLVSLALTATAVAGAVFVSPAAALAAQNNNVSGVVNSDASWTKGQVTRHKSNTGDIKFNLQNNVDGGICLRLRSLRNGSVFAGPVCWAPGEYGAHYLAYDVLENTEFAIDAHKGVSGGSNNDWGGIAWY